MREQAVAAGDVHDAAAPAPPADASRDFPRLVELLARQPVDAAHHPPDSIEQRVATETPEVVIGQPAVRARREVHTLSYRAAPAASQLEQSQPPNAPCRHTPGQQGTTLPTVSIPN